MEQIRIALVDDHELFRKGMEMLLNNINDFKLILSVESGEYLLEKLNDTVLDVVLLGI